MDPLLLAIILIAAAAAILACVAIYLGWFNLASSAAHDKVEFILTRKKPVEPKAPPAGKDPQSQETNKIEPQDRVD